MMLFPHFPFLVVGPPTSAFWATPAFAVLSVWNKVVLQILHIIIFKRVKSLKMISLSNINEPRHDKTNKVWSAAKLCT